MTYRENVKSILETCFSGYKEEIINVAVDNIMNIRSPRFILYTDGTVKTVEHYEEKSNEKFL